MTKLDQHKVITDCFLLKLLSSRADYDSVMEKVEQLHGLVEGLFAKRPSQKPAAKTVAGLNGRSPAG